MLQLRRLFALHIARLIVDTSRRQQGWLALTRGCWLACSSVLRAGTQLRRIVRDGDSWRRVFLARGGLSTSVLARTTLLAALLLASGAGTPLAAGSSVAMPQALLGRAGGSPPPLLLAATLTSLSSPHQTQAALPLSLRFPMFHYQRGYSVQHVNGHGWLCYGWASGMLHCTQRWSRSGGRYVSLNPGWVPSEGVASVVSVHTSVHTSAVSFSPAPAHLSQWAYTGRASYPEPRGTFQGYTWGWCTSGAALLAHDNLRGLGNAAEWARNAAARGMRVSSMPVAGATAVFQPFVQGAGGGGHVSHVAAVYGNGWFLSEDVNFWWNGGGFGRISFRYAHAGPGVSFIL